MSVRKLSIQGLRGFAENIDFEFAVPDKKNVGSGLTVLVGPNNSGKSTVIEALHLLAIGSDTLPKSARNMKTNGIVKIKAEDCNNNIYTLETLGSSYIEKKFNGEIKNDNENKLKIFILNNKRAFSSTFNNNMHLDRDNYIGNVGHDDFRNENNLNRNFGNRLINVLGKKREKFDKCLKKVLDPIPDWKVDSLNYNSAYLEFTFDDISHNSQGAGDGYISLFNIIDALYDSKEDNIIVIDEPEVSLHPDLQRRLFDLLVEYSKDKQIIISTHSPYFVDWELFIKYSKVIRLKKENNIIKKYELSQDTKKEIKSLLNDPCNPHTLSLNTNEIFFLKDNIILTEGQEDVVCYKKIFRNLKVKVNASFFGWGAGGADKIEKILNMLQDLGYEKVFTILDNNKQCLIEDLRENFPHYEYYAIQADDIREKKDIKSDKIIEEIKQTEIEEQAKNEIISIVKKNSDKAITGLVKNRDTCEINEQYKDDVQKLIKTIDKYFDSGQNKEDESKNDTKQKNEPEKENTNGQKAEDLVCRYIEKMERDIEKKYKYFNFNSNMGMGDMISLKKIAPQKYCALVEEEWPIAPNYSIKILFKLIINIKTNKVKARKKMIKNTLPISNIKKIVEKIICF